MTVVKGLGVAASEVHVAMLASALSRRINRELESADWDGLRISQMRVITTVPPEGVSITALAERVGMTKQGCGQFVTALTGTGHLRVDPDPADRRLRLVFRTEAGEALVKRISRGMAELEEKWAAEVGPRRYATFRKVLEELVVGG